VRSPRMAQKKKDMWFALLLIVPTALVLVRVFIVPIYQSAVWSLYHYDLLDGSTTRFVGLQNYVDALKSAAFWLATKRTFYFAVLTVVVELLLGFFIALLINQKFRGRTFFRAIIIIPWAMLTLVNGLLWDWIYQPGFGALTVVLHALHILPKTDNPVWLATSSHIMNFVAVADIWKMTPFMSLILLAGLQAIPEELYEAAAMDGAGFWTKLWHVTIPQLMPSIMVAVVLRIMGAFRVYDILTVFTGDPNTSLSYLTFNNAFRYFYFGKASALAWLSTLFILVLITLYIRMLKRNMEAN
jgi:ABC-type sugar transport system permease subunit